MNKSRMLGLPESTTPEELEVRFNDSKVLTFGNRVLMAGYRYNGLNKNGHYGAIYEFASEKHSCEDEIRLVKVSGEFFPDDGHAVAWAMTA